MKIKSGYIYMITYPNGKIYIGQDRTDDVNYFGSANSHLIENDIGNPEFITITKTILKRFSNIEIERINKIERMFIDQFRSNDPTIGYNRYPGLKMPPPKKQQYENKTNQ